LEIAAIAAPSINPDIGFVKLFFDSADEEKLKYKKSDGTSYDISALKLL
jgi:hypothetical protein